MVESLPGKRPSIDWLRPFRHPYLKNFNKWKRSKVRSFTPRMNTLLTVNFLQMHYGYFFLVCLLASILLWGSQTSTPGEKRLGYVDALFLAVSAQTMTGLNTVDLSRLNTFQQFILFAQLMLGSVVWVSIAIIQIRKTIFQRKIRKILAEKQVQTGLVLSSQLYSKIGGVEYRALCLLSYIVPAYFVLFQFFGCIGIGWWISVHKPQIPRSNGLNPWWMGSFNAVSAFNNSGMSLLDKNMAPFQESFYVLITMSLLILAGNTCFPIFLRLIVWTLYKLCPETSTFFKQKKEVLEFLLEHPRRCFPYLFKPRDTWWLAGAVVTLNGIDWLAFEILNIGNPAIEKIPLGARIMDGLFQAFAVRSGGFQVVPIIDTRIGLQVLYVFMMYISVYPVVMTIRNTNVYFEQSVGIYEKPTSSRSTASTICDGSTTGNTNPHSTRFFLNEQLRTQLAHDLWFLAFAIWVITIIETPNLLKDPINFSVFNIVFEAVSGYGTVGISIGHPDATYSFCGKWHWLSKIVLCAVMLRGRHRGLPVQIDSAIMVDEEELREVCERVSERD